MSEQAEIKNAIIDSVMLTTGDRGFLDCWLQLDYGDSGQGFGGYVLYLPKNFDNHKLESLAGHHIFRVMEIAGVDSWDKLKGRTIRAKATWGGVEAIGHIVKDDWYCPKHDFAKLKEGAKP